MPKNRFNLIRVENEENKNLDACKLLGAPVMPKGFLESLKLEPEDYFVAQIDCGAVDGDSRFPKKGFLYFFLNINSLQPKVFFTEKEPEELIEDVNDGFDRESCGDPTCLAFDFGEEGTSFLFDEVDPDIGLEGSADLDGKLTLLEIDALALPEGKEHPFAFTNFAMLDGHMVFLIKEEDLAKRNFKRVEFVEVES